MHNKVLNERIKGRPMGDGSLEQIIPKGAFWGGADLLDACSHFIIVENRRSAERFENDLAARLSDTLPSIAIQTLTRMNRGSTMDYVSRGLPMLLLDTQTRNTSENEDLLITSETPKDGAAELNTSSASISPAERELLAHGQQLRDSGTYEMYWCVNVSQKNCLFLFLLFPVEAGYRELTLLVQS